MSSRSLRFCASAGFLVGLTVFASARLASRGGWLPPLPARIGDWDVTEVPLSEEDTGILGKPSAVGFELINPLQERIYGRVIATKTYDAFQLPSILQRFYSLTAEKTIPLEGTSEKVLAQVFRQQGSELRIVMLSWMQRPDGSTSLLGLANGAGKSVMGRAIQGADGVFRENRSCVVRLFTILHPADPDGAQGRRNLLDAARNIRHGLLPVGKTPASSSSPLETQIAEGGKDMKFLAAAPKSDGVAPPLSAMLPLKAGNSWDFTISAAAKEGKEIRVKESVTVVGPVVIHGRQGMLLSISRGGRLWRQEVYRETPDTIELLAFGDSSTTRIELNPPLPLLHHPLKEGAETRWKGTLVLRGKTLPATGYSRISARESVVVPAGRFISFRTDTVLTVSATAKPTHFPSIRWLASGIGFVKRGYADSGLPAVAELQRFAVKS